MNGVLPAVRARLQAVLAGVTIALERAPDQPDELLLIRSYPSGPPRDLDARNRGALEHYSVQVLARAASAAAALDLAYRAYHALPGRHLSTAAGVIDWIAANHAPHLIGFDENDRPLATVVFTLQAWGELTVVWDGIGSGAAAATESGDATS